VADLICLVSEKQLLCMARAILKRSKILVMDEVGSNHFLSVVMLISSPGHRKVRLGVVVIFGLVLIFHSVDYATDELIGKTIRQ
jgi:ABC-type cobalamin/Fe3+-siderophores transport system ATPase subunit